MSGIQEAVRKQKQNLWSINLTAVSCLNVNPLGDVA